MGQSEEEDTDSGHSNPTVSKKSKRKAQILYTGQEELGQCAPRKHKKEKRGHIGVKDKEHPSTEGGFETCAVSGSSNTCAVSGSSNKGERKRIKLRKWKKELSVNGKEGDEYSNAGSTEDGSISFQAMDGENVLKKKKARKKGSHVESEKDRSYSTVDPTDHDNKNSHSVDGVEMMKKNKKKKKRKRSEQHLRCEVNGHGQSPDDSADVGRTRLHSPGGEEVMRPKKKKKKLEKELSGVGGKDEQSKADTTDVDAGNSHSADGEEAMGIMTKNKKKKKKRNRNENDLVVNSFSLGKGSRSVAYGTEEAGAKSDLDVTTGKKKDFQNKESLLNGNGFGDGNLMTNNDSVEDMSDNSRKPRKNVSKRRKLGESRMSHSGGCVRSKTASSRETDHQESLENVGVNDGSVVPGVKKRKHAVQANVEGNENLPGRFNFEKSDIEDIEPLIHPDTVATGIRANAELKEELLQLGIKFKTGAWSYEENERLRYNFKKFVEDYDIKEPESLLSSNLFTNRTELLKFLRRNRFYQRLARGILRTTYSCYKRARAVFHSNNCSKLDADEMKRVQELRDIHGNKWAKIGEALGRYGQSVNDFYKYYLTRKGNVTGRWTTQEQQQLLQAVQKELNTTDLEEMFYGLPYEKIAESIPTRNATQCRTEWLNVLCFLASHKMRPSSWTNEDKIKLITRLYEMDVDAECDVDWHQLYTEFDNIPSPQTLRAKWCQLRACVPNYQLLTFDAVCEHLFTHKVPFLMRKKTICLRKEKTVALSGEEMVTSDSDSD